MPSGRTLKSFAILLLLLLGYASLPSCGSNDHQLNTRKGEKVISEWLDRQGMSPESVECPSNIPMEKGRSFLCVALIAKANSLGIQIRVTQTSNSGEIRLAHANQVLSSERVERELTGQIVDQTGKKVTVDCGARARLVMPSKTFLCTVSDATLGVDGEARKPESYKAQVTMHNSRDDWSAQRL